MSPPKEKRAVESALKTAQLLAGYRALNLLQAPFGFVFWLIEQRKAKLQDCIDNERGRL